MERIGFLINKLKEQYERADSQDSMLVTLQMLYRELMPKLHGNLGVGKISVTIPGLMDMTFLEKNMEQKLPAEATPTNASKQLFELTPSQPEMAQPAEKESVTEIKPIEQQAVVETPKTEQAPFEAPKPAEKPAAPVVEALKNPFVKAVPKIETPNITAEPVLEEKTKYAEPAAPKPQILEEANVRYMPQQLKSTIEPAVEPTPPVIIGAAPKLDPLPIQPNPEISTKVTTAIVPPREVHETIQPDTQPSLNDKVEKRQPELFHTLKAEPLKDLKKAISINERFQYINHLFMKDETMYERSLKTINSFNVISEARFWIRKELATKMGWNDNDEVVQQFMGLVERRFS